MTAYVAEGVDRIRREVPLVHNVTNLVAMTLSANVLIAAGASPIMSAAPEEAGELAAMSRRPGRQHRHAHPRLDRRRAGGHRAAHAVPAAHGSSIPVGVGATAFRRDTAARPGGAGSRRIIRGNASEIMALAGRGGGRQGCRQHGRRRCRQPSRAKRSPARTGAVVAVTGAVDLVTDGSRTLDRRQRP